MIFSFSDQENDNSSFDGQNQDSKKKFDHVTIAQSWPQTACWGLNDKWNETDLECSSCPFMPKSKNSWVMHGLWPSKFNGNHPAFCKPELEYDPKLLNQSSLREKLSEEWPSMKFSKHNSNNDFWKHEWDKHGTCSLELPGIKNQTTYFTKSLELLNQYNVGKILSESGIVSGKMKYQYDDIIGAVKDALNVRVSLQCTKNTLNNVQYVDEIYICVDKYLKPIDCHDQTNCKIKDPIIYPRMLTTCS